MRASEASGCEVDQLFRLQQDPPQSRETPGRTTRPRPSRIGTTERGVPVLRSRAQPGRCRCFSAEPLQRRAPRRRPCARKEQYFAASLRRRSGARMKSTGRRRAPPVRRDRMTDRRRRAYSVKPESSAETAGLGDTQERLHAVERTVPECEVLLHGHIKIIANSRRSKSRLTSGLQSGSTAACADNRGHHGDRRDSGEMRTDESTIVTPSWPHSP